MGRRYGPAVALGGVVAVAALVVAIVIGTGGGGGSTSQALTLTNEINEMGMPVARTPGDAVGIAHAGGVEVQGAMWRMGTVPLLVAVRPTWTLVNSSDTAVTLGVPHAEVRAGCCPGPLTMGSRTLGPGESTMLTFELAMHPGMDGWHDIAVHVPVTSTLGGEDVLTLSVTGDFHGTFQS